MEQFLLIGDNALLMLYSMAALLLLFGFDKTRIKAKASVFMPMLAAILTVSALFIYFFGFNTYVMLELVLVQLPLYLLFKFMTRYEPLKVLFVILSAWIWLMPIMSLGNLASAPFEYNPLIKMVVHFALTPALLLLIWRYFVPIYRYMLDQLDKGWGLFSLLLFLCALITYTSSYFAIGLGIKAFHSSMVWRHLIFGLMFLIYLLVMMSFRQIKEQLTIRSELDLYKFQLTGATDHIGTLKTALQMQTLHQHDLRHHLQFISAKASTNDSSAILKYIHDLQVDIDMAKPVIFCKNETINLILTTFQLKARKNDVDIQVKGNLPEALSIPDADICVLLSNALENAVRATSLVTKAQRSVTISLHAKNDQLFLEITNPYTGIIEMREGLPLSSREGGGTGTKSIAYIVKKYAGLYDFSISDSTFTLQVIL